PEAAAGERRDGAAGRWRFRRLRRSGGEQQHGGEGRDRGRAAPNQDEEWRHRGSSSLMAGRGGGTGGGNLSRLRGQQPYSHAGLRCQSLDTPALRRLHWTMAASSSSPNPAATVAANAACAASAKGAATPCRSAKSTAMPTSLVRIRAAACGA